MPVGSQAVIIGSSDAGPERGQGAGPGACLPGTCRRCPGKGGLALRVASGARDPALVPADLQRLFVAPGTDMDVRVARIAIVAVPGQLLPGAHGFALAHHRVL